MATTTFSVYILVYPMLGGLGWNNVGDYTSRAAAVARVNELLRNGHTRDRVRINKA